MLSLERDEYYMEQALRCAVQGQERGEVPVGAVMVYQGQMIAQGYNQPILQHDPTAHAEVVALRLAAQLRQNYRLPGTTLYVTLEPCAMCVGAMVHARIDRVVFGAYDPKAGAAESCSSLFQSPPMNHRVIHQGGVLQARCSALLTRFFKQKR